MKVTRYTPVEDLPEFLRAEEVAAKLDCSASTIYALVKSGTLASIPLGRLVRIPRAAVAAWLDKGAAS